MRYRDSKGMAEVLKQHGTLIVVLAVVACARPLMNVFGLMQVIGQPIGSILATAVISLIWIMTVVYKRVEQPIIVLMFTGVAYGLLAIVLSGILSPILSGRLQGPLTNPFAIVSVLLTNAIWGAIAGVIASFWSRAVKG